MVKKTSNTAVLLKKKKKKIRLLHINLESNHFTEIHCYNTDASEVTLTRFSDLKCSFKHVFLVCGRRQCMSEVWLVANGLLKSRLS